ncbi:MAG: zinc ABC transporter substrate-binding protein [Muribaculaceae bacterium]|nr:zinc ABC transporter substrate-binding protein [Muribaculaceae bacterium]
MKCKQYIGVVAVMMAVLSMCGISSCGNRQSRKPVITVSIQPQKFFLEKIVGDRVEVKCLLANGGNPETYEPSLTHLLNLEKSEAYFKIGNIGFESAIINRVHNNNPDLRIYDTTDGVNLLFGTHGPCCGHGHAHNHGNEIDPHTWSSVKNAKIIAENMYNAMLDLDSGNEKYYTANYNRFRAELDSLDSEITEMLRDKRGTAFVVWHPSLSYFARDYGLEQISVGYEGKESSVQLMQQQLDEAREHDARVFFFQKDFDSRQASVVCEQLGVEVTPVNPLNYEWDKEIMSVADAIASK